MVFHIVPYTHVIRQVMSFPFCELDMNFSSSIMEAIGGNLCLGNDEGRRFVAAGSLTMIDLSM